MATECVKKRGERFELSLWGERSVHCPHIKDEWGRWVVRWSGTGILTDAKSSAEMPFTFITSVHKVRENEVETIPFWETIAGSSRQLSSNLGPGIIVDEVGLVDAQGEMVQKLWNRAFLDAFVPDIILSPFVFHYSRQHGLRAISDELEVSIRTISLVA